jgi:hypothetical protein
MPRMSLKHFLCTYGNTCLKMRKKKCTLFLYFSSVMKHDTCRDSCGDPGVQAATCGVEERIRLSLQRGWMPFPSLNFYGSIARRGLPVPQSWRRSHLFPPSLNLCRAGGSQCSNHGGRSLFSFLLWIFVAPAPECVFSAPPSSCPISRSSTAGAHLFPPVQFLEMYFSILPFPLFNSCRQQISHQSMVVLDSPCWYFREISTYINRWHLL